MEKMSREPAPQASTHADVQRQSPAADSQKVAFRLGGSEEADLDSSDLDTKDTDVTSENLLYYFLSSELYLCVFFCVFVRTHMHTQISLVFGSLFMTKLPVILS